MRAELIYIDMTATAQDHSIDKSLADILLNKKLINKTTFDLIKNEQVNTGKDQEAIIRDRNLVDDKSLILAKSEFYQIPFVQFAPILGVSNLYNQTNLYLSNLHSQSAPFVNLFSPTAINMTFPIPFDVSNITW